MENRENPILTSPEFFYLNIQTKNKTNLSQQNLGYDRSFYNPQKLESCHDDWCLCHASSEA